MCSHRILYIIFVHLLLCARRMDKSDSHFPVSVLHVGFALMLKSLILWKYTCESFGIR